jgi:hypothetical protein
MKGHLKCSDKTCGENEYSLCSEVLSTVLSVLNALK